MAGHEDYSCVLDPEYTQVEVPLYPATEESIKQYGRLVHDFEKEEVGCVLSGHIRYMYERMGS